jgi:hypothetical protein
MTRFMSLALAVAVLVPFAATSADAASKKKKKNGSQVFGFVQTSSSGLGGTLSNPNRFGERRINGYTDNTRQFFAHIANKGSGGR